MGPFTNTKSAKNAKDANEYIKYTKRFWVLAVQEEYCALKMQSNI